MVRSGKQWQRSWIALRRFHLGRDVSLIDACKLATLAPSLGGTETLIEQPALMSFYELSTEERLAIGVHEDLVRLSVGIESLDDIIADLGQALAAVTA